MNEVWERGIASSIHAGLGMLKMFAANAPGVLILTCDQPRLTSAHLARILGMFLAQPESAIVASAYGETVGTPAIFPRSVFPELRALEGDTGARAILKNPPCPVIEVPFPGGEIDIDTPADLESLT
jgi:CTP:molybdopterin cytidylyltransferase MocA